jgi:ribosome-dependent ATPase
MMSVMNAIEIEDLTKRFGNFTAVDPVDFKVEAGELIGF